MLSGSLSVYGQEDSMVVAQLPEPAEGVTFDMQVQVAPHEPTLAELLERYRPQWERANRRSVFVRNPREDDWHPT